MEYLLSTRLVPKSEAQIEIRTPTTSARTINGYCSISRTTDITGSLLAV